MPGRSELALGGRRLIKKYRRCARKHAPIRRRRRRRIDRGEHLLAARSPRPDEEIRLLRTRAHGSADGDQGAPRHSSIDIHAANIVLHIPDRNATRVTLWSEALPPSARGAHEYGRHIQMVNVPRMNPWSWPPIANELLIGIDFPVAPT